MSTIEVDKLIPQSGTSVQIGENGDTITIPAGATFDASAGTITLADGSVTTAKIADGAVSLVKLSATGTKDNTTFLRGDNTFQVVNTDLVSDTSPQLGGNLDGNNFTADFTTNNTSLGLPKGTTAQRPATTEGHIRYNTTEGAIFFANGSQWIKINSEISSLTSVSGTLYSGLASDLTLAGAGFGTANLVVNFTQTDDSIDEDVTVTPSSTTAATVSVPAAVYNNVTAGNSVSIKVTNSDGVISNIVGKTATATPSGGTITISGNNRIHTFTSSGTFTNTVANLSCDYLIVAGGGAGGSDAGGGGGAGGMRTGTFTFSTGDFTATVGAGGASGGGGGSPSCPGNDASPGGDSSINSITSTGGGKGGMGESRDPCKNGGNGGSGGGGGGTYPSNNNGGSGGSGTSGQGNSGAGGLSTPECGGGGGGKGGSGSSQNGGGGSSSSISGSSVTYAGGGGGGTWGGGPHNAGAGGSGGGGNGGGYPGKTSAAGAAGGTNLGGGGGAGSQNSGGNGGSGIIIISYNMNQL
jgi:hypothetical protein